MLLTFEVWSTAGHVQFDGLNLSQVTMIMMLICITVRPETKQSTIFDTLIVF